MRWQPAVRTPRRGTTYPLYYRAGKLGARALQNFGLEAGCAGGSFHGLPQNISTRATPITAIAKTARLLREKLKLPETKFKLTFQSRFGPTKWLEPYTDKTVEAWRAMAPRKLPSSHRALCRIVWKRWRN